MKENYIDILLKLSFSQLSDRYIIKVIIKLEFNKMEEIKNTNLSEEELRLILKNVMIMESFQGKRIKVLETFNFLISNGWDRRKIYLVLFDIYKNADDLTERQDDFIFDFLGELRGDAGLVGLFSLPYEPLDKHELYKHIQKVFFAN
jgi:hypothetical protein